MAFERRMAMGKTETDEVYQCATCGIVTAAEGHLCQPRSTSRRCHRCGQPIEDARHMCKPMREKLEYVCETCGRPTEEARLVCRPRKMPG